MTLRKGHGSCAGTPRIEVLPPDELPEGVPAPAGPPEIRRTPEGHPADEQSARALASLGGQARAEQLRLKRLLGRVELPDEHPLKPYRQDAADWRDAHLARLAATVGGGECGPAVQAIVSTAALQHAASRWLFDRSALEQHAKFAIDASRLGDAARQNLLAAHELCAREAVARGKHSTPAWLQLGAPSTAADASSPPKTDVESPAPADASAGQPEALEEP